MPDAPDDVTTDPAWLSGLNPAQRAAATHGDGPLLVAAGAGTGKTATLVARVAHLMDRGVAPERILLLTFTRRAAREMLQRVRSLTGDPAARRVQGGTFHSVANTVLRRHGSAVGLPPGFTILDAGDAADLMGLVRAELGVGDGERRFPRASTLTAIHSRTVNAGRSLDEVLERAFPWCRDHQQDIAAIFRRFTERKRAHGVVDFDDLLLYWRALAAHPTAGPAVRTTFDHVLVDEFQDTNTIQADLLRALMGPQPNLTVVGDDAQAIYSFRAASVRNILDFPVDHPTASVVRLERNYRSTAPILRVANGVMEGAPESHGKVLWTDRSEGPLPRLVTTRDETDQAAYVCDRILEARERGVALREQCVLFRTAQHSDGLELELQRRDIPYVKYGGLRFLEAAHLKDLVAMLRVLDNPDDELAWSRSLQQLPGVGPRTVQRVLAELGVGAGHEPDPLQRFLAGPVDLPAPAELVGALRGAWEDARGGDGVEPAVAVQIERLRQVCALTFPDRYDDHAARLADLDHLAELAGAGGARARFLADLTLDPPASTSDLAQPPDLDDDHLTLSTIHSAKGGEWRRVHVIHAADGNIPSDMAVGTAEGVEEERRLLHVALTRAKDELEISYPLRFYHQRHRMDDAHSWAQPSRFLGIVARDCEPVVRALDTDMEDTVVHEAAADPVDAYLAALW